MQLSTLRSTALALLLVACGDDSGGGGETTNDAAVSETPKSDGGLDSGNAAVTDTGVTIRNDSSVPDTGTKPATDSGTPTETDGGGTVADTGTSTTPTDAGSTPTDAGPAATGESFAALYADIFSPRCKSCHTATHTSGLFMDSIASMYPALLKATGSNQSGSPGSPCATMTTNPRVAPGDPSKSWILVMLAPPPHCGKQMPPDPAEKLSAAEQKRISDWIAQGAKNN
jgi:hypothetical protein